MAKKIVINYQGNEYTLEFTRRSVEQLEKQGFRAADLAEKPMSTLPVLFAGAFLANHRWVKKDVIDEIYSGISNRQELISKLAEMYNEPLEAMLGEPEDRGDGKNAAWEASW